MKRWHDENRVENKARPGRPKKLSERDAHRLRRMTQREPRATLADITGSSGLNVSIRTVRDYLQKQNLYVRVSRRKPYLNRRGRYLRRSFAHHWSGKPNEWWQRHVYTDEVYLHVGPVSRRPPVRRPPGTAFEERYLAPTFIGKPTTVQFFAAFTSIGHSQLVPLRQRKASDRTTPKDRLGFNSSQYVHEVMIPHILPLYQQMGGLDSGTETIEDGANYHTSAFTRRFRMLNGIKRMDWPPHSPDLNPIENVWSISKAHFRRRIQNPYQGPHGGEEIIRLAQEVWEGLPWGRIYKMIDCMPAQIVALRKAHGDPTRW